MTGVGWKNHHCWPKASRYHPKWMSFQKKSSNGRGVKIFTKIGNKNSKLRGNRRPFGLFSLYKFSHFGGHWLPQARSLTNSQVAQIPPKFTWSWPVVRSQTDPMCGSVGGGAARRRRRSTWEGGRALKPDEEENKWGLKIKISDYYGVFLLL